MSNLFKFQLSVLVFVIIIMGSIILVVTVQSKVFPLQCGQPG